MKYKQYHNGSVFILLGVLLFALFGGIPFFFDVMGVLFSSAFQLVPLILVLAGLYFLFRLFFKRRRMGNYVNQFTRDKRRFVELTVRILMLAAESDGRADDQEQRTILHFFETLGYSQKDLDWVRDLIEHAAKNPASFDEVVSAFNQAFNYQSKEILLELVYRVLSADHVISSIERAFIDKIILKFGIQSHDANRIGAYFERYENKEAAYYDILGVPQTATKETIKKAYREAIKQHHPDKVHHLGPEFVKVAEEQLKKINEAYEFLSKKSR